jgi:hypothetical protein
MNIVIAWSKSMCKRLDKSQASHEKMPDRRFEHRAFMACVTTILETEGNQVSPHAMA